jgi:hypothetical protein
MEQSVRRYLDNIVKEVPKPGTINGQRVQNTAHLVDIRQRFSGMINITRKEDMYLGMSNTKFTLYKMAPYFNRAGVPDGADKFDTLCDVLTFNVPGSYVYYDPTGDENDSVEMDFDDFHAQDFR